MSLYETEMSTLRTAVFTLSFKAPKKVVDRLLCSHTCLAIVRYSIHPNNAYGREHANAYAIVMLLTLLHLQLA